MKIRKDFVTNSSSTGYLLYNTSIKDSTILMLNLIIQNLDHFLINESDINYERCNLINHIEDIKNKYIEDIKIGICINSKISKTYIYQDDLFILDTPPYNVMIYTDLNILPYLRAKYKFEYFLDANLRKMNFMIF